jgi:hypothetical protein
MPSVATRCGPTHPLWAASIERAAAPAMCGNPITHHVAGPGPSTEIRLDARAPRSRPSIPDHAG